MEFIERFQILKALYNLMKNMRRVNYTHSSTVDQKSDQNDFQTSTNTS